MLISSSLTILTTCWAGLSAPETSAPLARSLIRLMKARTTGSATSASSSAMRISRAVASMSASERRPLPRRSRRAPLRRSERVSNTHPARPLKAGPPCTPLQSGPDRHRLSAIRAIVVEIRIPIGTLRSLIAASAQARPAGGRVTALIAAAKQLIVRIRKGGAGGDLRPVRGSDRAIPGQGANRRVARSAVSGAPGPAVRLFREVTEFGTDPTRPLRAVVCGPGGSGKSVLLGLLADALRGAGVTVVDDAENAVDPDPGRRGPARRRARARRTDRSPRCASA